MSLPSSPLQLPRSRSARWTGIGLLTAVVVGLAVWHVNSPSSLATSETPVVASTPVGRSVFIGVFTPASDFERTLELSGVKVHATSSAQPDLHR